MSRVLVVDDEEAYRTLMAGHLERKGMSVATAANGAAALDAMQAEGPFNVVVTDMMSPRTMSPPAARCAATRSLGGRDLERAGR